MLRATTPLVCAALVVVWASGCGGGNTGNSAKTNSSRDQQSGTTATTSVPSTTTVPPSSACTAVPGAIGPVPDWLPAEFFRPGGTTFVGQRGDGAGGHIAVFAAPGTSPADYTASLTAQLLGAGWAVAARPEDYAPNDEREGAFVKAPQSIVFRINTYTYCGGVAQLTVDVNGF